MSRLLSASLNGTTDQVKWILWDEPMAIHARDHRGNTALHLAARGGTSSMVTVLATAFTQAARLPNGREDTPLHVAAHFANLKVVDALLQADPSGAALRAVNMHGNTPLHCAAASLKPLAFETFQALLEAAPELATAVNTAGNTPAHCAASSGNAQVLEVLAARHPDLLKVCNAAYKMPVHLAVIQYVNMTNLWSKVAVSSVEGMKSTVALLLARHTLVNSMKELGIQCTGGLELRPSVLHTAAYLGHNSLASLVMELDASAALQTDVTGSYPIHYAAFNGAAGIVRTTLELFPHLAYQTNDCLETPLHCAAQSSSAETVAVLLQTAPETANSLMMDGCTATFQAAAVNNLGGLRHLLDAAPHTAERTDMFGCQPVYAAAIQGHAEAVDMLMRLAPHTALDAGPYGFNALHAAAEQSWSAAVEVLLGHLPALASTTVDEGDTALHVAIKPSFDEDGSTFKEDPLAAPVVESILRVAPELALVPTDFGASGCLPLHIAAALGMNACVAQLVGAGPAAVLHTNAAGHTPLEAALLNGHTGTAVEVLQVPGQDPSKLLGVLNRLGMQDSPELYLATIASCVPLPRACWDLIPTPLDGMLDAMPAVLLRGNEEDSRQGVARLPAPQMKTFTTALSCIRALPADVSRTILARAL